MEQPLQLSPLRAAAAAATVQLHGACGTGTGLFWHWGGVAVVSRCGHFGDNIPPFHPWLLVQGSGTERTSPCGGTAAHWDSAGLLLKETRS